MFSRSLLTGLGFLIISGILSCSAQRTSIREEEDKESVRWRVKTLTDPDTSFVRFDRVVVTTIKEQAALKQQQITSSTPRLAGETTVFELTAELVAVKREFDGDYHLVLREPGGDLMMIAELPDAESPAIIGSGRAPLYREASKVIDSLIGRSPRKYLESDVVPPKKIRLTGVGFFDGKHLIPQKGMLDNRRELHPILSVVPLD